MTPRLLLDQACEGLAPSVHAGQDRAARAAGQLGCLGGGEAAEVHQGDRDALLLAHLTVVLPYVVLVLTAGFGERLADLEEMGQTMGAGWPRRLALVTVPSLRPTLAAATVIGFLVSWGQYGLSLAVGGGLSTLPIVLLPFVRTDPQVAAAIAVLLLAPAVAGLAATLRIGHRPP